MKQIIKDILTSWSISEGKLISNNEILEWVGHLNNSLTVNITPTTLGKNSFWFYNKQGEICNQNNSFFSIKGLKAIKDEKEIMQQPVIIQDEIGYLGMICKKIDGVLYFLIQAKIEPGNINKIQLSPTIQATKSNFTQKHGGAKPAYVEYFLEARNDEIVVDQIQSEQSSRFYKKRNRNIIIKTKDDIELLPNFKWVTLGQIKELMKFNNLVNMDTRTVLSCIPFILADLNEEELIEIEKLFNDKALFKSLFNKNNLKEIVDIYHYINNYKMFNEISTCIVPLDDLNEWEMDEEGIRCKKPYNFSVIYCDIEVEGREVRKWMQPLVKAEGLATFGLFTAIVNGERKFLVKGVSEIGCFDKLEIGPTVQLEAVNKEEIDEITSMFLESREKGKGILYEVALSEEGGRFYHEQNHNIIIETEVDKIGNLPEGYFWVSYRTLNYLLQVNNCLNIQLRNLLSLLEV